MLPAVTAQYFLVKLYWKCFFASLWAAVTGRVLFWLYKAATDTDIFGGVGEARTYLDSMLSAHDVEGAAGSPRIVASQIVPFVLVGLCTGLAGVLFVKLNQMWMRFRQRHAHAWPFRHRFVWSSVYILLWGLVSFPGGPFGPFMSKCARRAS